ncbi:hypothetical protein AB0O91_05030 [Kitasatospora sp. NPDC089797]|uniref:hypothetical protein n=1 Tax=Kitasatospora sp. NPDC089797 TaxID=3155298 RepID=UPI00342DF714
MPENDHPQPEDVLVDVTPAAPCPRPRRRLWPALGAVALLGAGTFGVVFADNFANLGAYRYSPPKSFTGLAYAPEASRAKQPGTLGSESGVSATAYLGDGDRSTVFVTVEERHIFTPSSELDDLLARQRADGIRLDGFRDVDPGERGGAMKCGTTVFQGQHLAVCDWADGSMWGTYTEAESGAVPDLGAAVDHARDFRRQAEVPS